MHIRVLWFAWLTLFLCIGRCTIAQEAVKQDSHSQPSATAIKPFSNHIDPQQSKGQVHIVYVLDTSASMNEKNKIGKAKQALRGVISILKPTDTFNIITFDKDIHPFEKDLVKASADNIKRALKFIDGIKAHGLTFLSGAMEVALSMKSAHEIYLMSDGEPAGGIEDFDKLCAFVKEHNDQHAHINTLALGIGEKFKGMKLLKDIADQNGGTYVYINLATAK